MPPVAWVLLLANVFWAIAYDTEYAMVDRDDDIHLGIHSSALFFGKHDVVGGDDAVTPSRCFAGLRPGRWQDWAVAYFIGLIVAEGITLYHYMLIKGRSARNASPLFCITTGSARRCLREWWGILFCVKNVK